ncbi:N-acetyltransferase [soil metagenome]
MGIRLETHWDHAEVRRLVTAAFGRRAEAELVDKLRETDGFVPQLSLVADHSGVVVGHIMFTRITLQSDPPIKVLALAPVSVYPAFQNKGIGSALIKRGLAIADQRDEPLVVVLGHPGYYPRFGFVPASTLGIASPWPDMPDDAFMVKTLSSYSVDIKGMVRYPPEFDET